MDNIVLVTFTINPMNNYRHLQKSSFLHKYTYLRVSWSYSTFYIVIDYYGKLGRYFNFD